MNTTTTTTATSQICPDIGAWRAWLDHECTMPEPERQQPAMQGHLSSCPACQRLVAELRDDASSVSNVLAALAPGRDPNPAEVGVARERLERRRRRAPPIADPTRARMKVLEPFPMFMSRLSMPWRVAGSGLAAALVLAVVVAFTPEGGSAAAAFLAQFRSQQVSVIEVTPQSQADIMRSLDALGNLGTVQTPTGNGETRTGALAREVAGQPKAVSLAEAAQTVGFSLSTPDVATLPAGIDKTPSVRVSPGSQVRFTFDKVKARAYYQSTGHPEVTLPDKFNGATLSVTIPSAAILHYGTGPSSNNDVVVVEAGELVVDVQGNVSLPEMRDFLLGLPGLPRT